MAYCFYTLIVTHTFIGYWYIVHKTSNVFMLSTGFAGNSSHDSEKPSSLMSATNHQSYEKFPPALNPPPSFHTGSLSMQ